MSLEEQKDYGEEAERLKYTLEHLERYNKKLLNEKERLDSKVEFSRKHLGADNSQQYIDVMVGSTIQESLEVRLKKIAKTQGKPYFARVDFTENETGRKEKLYIGKLSLIKESDNSFIIIDWRAPVANLYYEGRLGKAFYTCPDGKIEGKIHLKRQFTIEEGKLQEFFDIDITTNDEFLQACLKANADNRLKDIVSTIQGEQNRVIRSDMWKPLIVQGAAGGGKTTIALHRIAYLIYTYEKSFKPENFMIIAPSRFFLSYISGVLPELGVENVKQTTFEDFAGEVLGKKLSVTESNEKLSAFVNAKEGQIHQNKLERIISEFKSSIHFKDVVESYMKEVEDNFIPHKDLAVDDYILFKYEDIKELFINEYSNLPMMKRITEIKKHIKNKFQREKETIIDDMEGRYDREVRALKDKMEDSVERRRLIIEASERRDQLIQRVKRRSDTILKEYISEIPLQTPVQYYKNLLQNKNAADTMVERFISKEDYEYMKEGTTVLMGEGRAEQEDLAPLMYIKYLVYGLDEKIAVRHIVIDEAQDFSLFQLYVLRKMTNNCSFTILGDLCQGIHSYRGIKDWKDVLRYVFGENNCKLLNMEQSYRTTVEIMEAANSVIKLLGDDNLPAARPVLRHGEKVSLQIKGSYEDIAEDIRLRLAALQKEGFKSAAVICKTMEECIKLQTLLKGTGAVLITGKEREYKGGIVIVPSYLSKGLEFDAVIIANASSEMYSCEELDVKLLYVAMTRPLHRLYIYSYGEIAQVLRLLAA